MHVQRLQLMAALLMEVVTDSWRPTVPTLRAEGKQVQFHIGCWGTGSGVYYFACPMGHAALDERFSAQGIRVSDDGQHLEIDVPVPGMEPEVLTDLDAIAYFFEISAEQAEALFMPQGYTADPRRWMEVQPMQVWFEVTGFLKDHGYAEVAA
jgi:hypothetical protein